MAEDGLEVTVKAGAQLVGTPVAASSTTKLVLAVSLLPTGDPAGRTDVIVPPTKTLPCALATAHAIPLV